MGKRYVFWRTPDGRPCRDPRQEDTFYPNHLLARLGGGTKVTEDGFSWGHDLFRLRTAIEARAVVLDPEGVELNDADSAPIIQAAIHAVMKRIGAGHPVPSSEVLSEADKIAAKHFREAQRPFVVVTSLSISALPTKVINVHGCRVRALPEHNRFKYPPSLLHDDRIPKRYCRIRVDVKGRTHNEAMARAGDALRLLCGLWNFFQTYGTWVLRLGSSRQIPITSIHTGGVHTLHESSGKCVGDYYWYEPGFIREDELFKSAHQWPTIEKHRRWAMGQMKRVPHGEEIAKLFRRYAVALDHSDLNVAFLQLWGILEKLTDTVGADYSATIKKASYTFGDRELAKDFLTALRVRRNQYVHAAQDGQKHDQMLYILKLYVDNHLLHLLKNTFLVESLQEYGQYLSFPRSLEELEKQRRRFQHAIRTIKKWDATM